MSDFCRFVTDFDADNVVFAHLHEVSRDPDNYWSYMHAGLIMDHLLMLKPEIHAVALRTGQKVTLW